VPPVDIARTAGPAFSTQAGDALAKVARAIEPLHCSRRPENRGRLHLREPRQYTGGRRRGWVLLFDRRYDHDLGPAPRRHHLRFCP
jgi:hypothetical protein